MLPKWHILLGFLYSIFVYYFFNLNIFFSSIIFLSSFLIDFDHYLYYVVNKQDINLKRAYGWFKEFSKKYQKLSKKQKTVYKRSIIIFHGIEFFILIILLSFYYKIFLFILIGISFHILLDFISIIHEKEPISTKLSFIYNLKRNKNKKSIKTIYIIQ